MMIQNLVATEAAEMSISVPRRRGFAIAWTVLRVTLEAYRRRSPRITWSIREDEPKVAP